MPLEVASDRHLQPLGISMQPLQNEYLSRILTGSDSHFLFHCIFSREILALTFHLCYPSTVLHENNGSGQCPGY